MLEQIHSLIGQAKHEKAFLLLETADSNDVTLLKSRYTRLKYSNMTGVTSASEYNIEMNKITLAMLDLAKELFGDGSKLKKVQVDLQEEETNSPQSNISNMTHFDIATTLLRTGEKIQSSPVNRISIHTLLAEARTCQNVLADEELQKIIADMAALSVSQYVNQGFNNIVFRQEYDRIVNELVNSMQEYVKMYDTYAIKNQTAKEALQVLVTAKNLENLESWANALIRECGTDFQKIESIKKSYGLWSDFITGKASRELSFIMMNQIIPDLQKIAQS